MRITTLTITAALAFASISPALANDLKPIESQSIRLGGVNGDAYYTVEPDGFHVVATFGQRDGLSTPVRFQAVLSPGQALTVSTPRAAGEQPISLSIKRQGQHVTVDEVALTN